MNCANCKTEIFFTEFSYAIVPICVPRKDKLSKNCDRTLGFIKSLHYLVDKKMGDLMHAEQDATIDTFKLNNFKFREILLNEINEEAMGTLMAFSIMETIAACIYFEVDPFDQPAVEQGKILTKKYLS